MLMAILQIILIMIKIKEVTKEVEIAVSLKHIGNFWNSLNILLLNCEVSLTLSWSETCVITSMEKRILVAGQPNRGDSPTNAVFKIKDCKLHVPVVILSAENDNTSTAIENRI